jgi:hypothetical protein
MTRINASHNTEKSCSFMTWGKNTGALIFAALLIVCSVTVGCSSDKPKTVSSNNQIPVPQTSSPIQPMNAPVMQAENKPAAQPAKKVVHKKPATVNYTDKTYGVTFEYPRRYAIETGDAATELLTSTPLPMNFVQSGGVALAAIELPETSFANTDFSSAFFNVSVHKGLTADQCTEFAVPQPKVVSATASTEAAPAQTAPVQTISTAATAAQASTEGQSSSAESTTAQAAPAASNTATSPEVATASTVTRSQAASSDVNLGSKLMLGDLELHGTEAVAGEGSRQSDSKYFHVFQNGSCYEFGLNVTTVASDQGITKHVDRDKVFSRLEQILSTVKISPVVASEATAEAPKTAESTGTPAQ